MKLPDELCGFDVGESRVAYGLIGLLFLLLFILLLALLLDPSGGGFYEPPDASPAVMSLIVSISVPA